jgi:Domain of unknown function (DUF4118)
MDDERRLFGLVFGGITPILLAMLLVPVRDVLSSVNIALILVVAVVAAAAVGGRLAGVVAAVMATLSFDFFHTEPYLSLRITSQDDVETALTLLGVGLLVGTVASQAHRARSSADEQRDELRSIHRVAELAASGVPAGLVVEAACSELTSLMGLRSCTFSTGPGPRDGVVLDRRGAIGGKPRSYVATRHGFELPRTGVSIEVLDRGRLVGWLDLVPTPGVGVPLHTRTAAVVIADQLGGALSAPPEEPSVTTPNDPRRTE